MMTTILSMALAAGAAVAFVLGVAVLLLRLRSELTARWRAQLAALGAVETLGPLERLQRRRVAFLLFSIDYLTDRKNIVVHAIVFPAMVILVFFSVGLPLAVRAGVVVAVVGGNMARMRLERRRRQRRQRRQRQQPEQRTGGGARRAARPPVVTATADIEEYDGQRGEVRGVYHAVPMPSKRPRHAPGEAPPQTYAVVRLSDGLDVFLEPYNTPAAKRAPEELAALDRKRVIVAGTVHRIMPSWGQAPLAPCVSAIDKIEKIERIEQIEQIERTETGKRTDERVPPRKSVSSPGDNGAGT